MLSQSNGIGIGLSPRVRGNRLDDELHAGRDGSIPACAGEPGAPRWSRPSPTVYPRVCGGTTARNRPLLPVAGLSPRVRGNRIDPARVASYAWSIPACAGEPRDADGKHDGVGVYPRVCGGTTCPALARDGPGGLSPRVRGNLGQAQTSAAAIRSIPACAGEPSSCGRSKRFRGVYPRVCGGTPDQGGLSDTESGSIPACAGEPKG